MIQRRQFLGSMAAACVVSGSASQLIAGTTADKTRPLHWRCDTINTVTHGYALRAPVVTGVSLQPQGNLIAIVGDDHYVCVYDMARKQFVTHLGEHTDWVRATAFSPDGARLASAGNDRRLLIWNSNDWSAPATVVTHSEAIIGIAFTHDSQKIATVGFEQTLRLYDVQTRELIMQRNCDCADNHAVAFSRDDRMMAAAGRSGQITVWDTASGNNLNSIKAHRKRIRSLEFTEDGQVISCSDDQTVRISNPLEKSNGRLLQRYTSKLYGVALLSQDLLATSGSDNLIHILRISDALEIGALRGHTGTVSCLDVSGIRMASGSYDTQVRIWDLEDNLGADRQTKLPGGWNRKFE